MRLEEVSAALQAALDQAEPGPSGMRSVRAVGADGDRYVAGLHDQRVIFLRLPYPNPDGQYERLEAEPGGVSWQPHQPAFAGPRGEYVP
jgi:hypothetical protein